MPNKQQGNGSTVAIIIIVIVLLAGAIYMWRNLNKKVGFNEPRPSYGDRV